MSRYETAKAEAALIMPRLVDAGSNLVRFNSFKALQDELVGFGFLRIDTQQYGPPGGFQIFFVRKLSESALLVRVKTLGEQEGRPRANTPHMSMAVTDGNGLLWMHERAKVTATGTLQTKAMTTVERFNPDEDFQKNPQYFVMIMGGQYDGPGAEAWADSVHFAFPPNVDFSGARSL